MKTKSHPILGKSFFDIKNDPLVIEALNKAFPSKNKKINASTKYYPNPELAAIIGPYPIKASQALVKLWGYLKANKLGNGTIDQLRLELEGNLLKPLFLKDNVVVLEMNEIIKRHIINTSDFTYETVLG